MWSTTALLFIVSLGVSTIFAADLNSDADVHKFLDALTRSIASKDAALISGHFHPEFTFKGCNGVYDRKKAVEILSNLPAGAKSSFNLKSSEYRGAGQIKYTVEINGFGKPLVAQFYLHQKEWTEDYKLESGSVVECPKARFARDDAQTTVQKFLERMKSSIESKDVSIISGLFKPGFIFKGCKGTYDKTKIVGMITNVPAGAKFSFTLKSAQDLGSTIKYVVSLSTPDRTEIVAEFILNKADQQLESGHVPECPKTRVARSVRATAKDYSETFMKKAKEVIRRVDLGAVAKLFDDKFVVQGCAGKYDKAASLAQIGRIDTENPFDYKLVSAAFSNKEESEVMFISKIYGIWDDFTAEFFYDVDRGVLMSGKYLSCKSKQPVTRAVRDAKTDEVIKNFMITFESAFYSVNRRSGEDQMRAMINDNFTLTGCPEKEDTHDKESIIANMRIYYEIPFYYVVLSSRTDKQNNIEFLMMLRGVTYNDIFALFVYSPQKNELLSAKHIKCHPESD